MVTKPTDLFIIVAVLGPGLSSDSVDSTGGKTGSSSTNAGASTIAAQGAPADTAKVNPMD